MVAMPVQEIKRRGMSAMNEHLASGPVWVISNNVPKYVVMFGESYRQLEDELSALRVQLSEADVRAGRVTRGSADDLMAELSEN